MASALLPHSLPGTASRTRNPRGQHVASLRSGGELVNHTSTLVPKLRRHVARAFPPSAAVPRHLILLRAESTTSNHCLRSARRSQHSLAWHPLCASPSSPGPTSEAGTQGKEPEVSAAPTNGSSRSSTDSSSSVGPTAETSPLVRLAWYASEAFGKVAAVVRQPSSSQEESQGTADPSMPLSRAQAAQLLREDYDRSYFVTGAMTMELYEPECEFADPFVSFKGRARFKQNVSNLGSFMEEVSLKVLDWQESEDKVTTKWRFSCVLALPWRPILAASGGTDHFFDKDSGRIYKHVERWDISPVDGLRQLIKPNPKLRKKTESK